MKWIVVKRLDGKVSLNSNEHGITFVCSDIELTEHSYILLDEDREWMGYLSRDKNEIIGLEEAMRDENP